MPLDVFDVDEDEDNEGVIGCEVGVAATVASFTVPSRGDEGHDGTGDVNGVRGVLDSVLSSRPSTLAA